MWIFEAKKKLNIYSELGLLEIVEVICTVVLLKLRKKGEKMGKYKSLVWTRDLARERDLPKIYSFDFFVG